MNVCKEMIGMTPGRYLRRVIVLKEKTSWVQEHMFGIFVGGILLTSIFVGDAIPPLTLGVNSRDPFFSLELSI